MTDTDSWVVPYSELKYSQDATLGSGNFGIVFKGESLFQGRPQRLRDSGNRQFVSGRGVKGYICVPSGVAGRDKKMMKHEIMSILFSLKSELGTRGIFNFCI